MSINPQEENLRRLRVIQSLVRKEIDTTKDLRKKEMYRKKHEKISKELEETLKSMKLDWRN